jgi:hypothetical protein
VVVEAGERALRRRDRQERALAGIYVFSDQALPARGLEHHVAALRSAIRSAKGIPSGQRPTR